ncbi:MAG: amidohydrolase family protein, partial [Arenicellales bacterium]
MTQIIQNATVVTVDSAHGVIADGAVVIDKDRIVAVGDSQTLVRTYSNVDEVIEGYGKVVMPGFVSAHNHLGYAVFRGRAEDVGHAPTHRLYLPMSGIISASEREAIGALAVAELLRGGVTTILEMEEEAELFAPFIESSGIRALMGVMVNDVRLDALA